MHPKLAKLIKGITYNSPFRKWFFPRYQYNFTPPQLLFMCQCLEDTSGVAGAVAEIGCAAGHTTIFLNKFMDASNIEKPYFAIDTFSGFVTEDVELEIRDRDKLLTQITGFEANNKNTITTP